MAVILSVKIAPADGPPVWEDLIGATNLTYIEMSDVVILEKGMQSGRPSVLFRHDLPGMGDGQVVVSETSARQILMLAKIIEGRFPDILQGD